MPKPRKKAAAVPEAAAPTTTQEQQSAVAPPAPPEETVPTVSGSVVMDAAGKPFRAIGRRYDPEFPAMMVQFFERVLDESSGETRAISDGGSSEVRTKKELQEAPPGMVVDPDKPAPPKQILVTTERKSRKEQKWRDVCKELPSFQGFARELGCSVVSLRNWKALYPNFCEAWEMCVDMLEVAVSERALNGRYNADFAKFVLTNWTNMRDRREITGADGAPLNPPPEYRLVSSADLDAAYAMLAEAKRKLLSNTPATAEAGGVPTT